MYTNLLRTITKISIILLYYSCVLFFLLPLKLGSHREILFWRCQLKPSPPLFPGESHIFRAIFLYRSINFYGQLSTINNFFKLFEVVVLLTTLPFSRSSSLVIFFQVLCFTSSFLKSFSWLLYQQGYIVIDSDSCS